MVRFLLLLFAAFLLSGCFAIIDNSGEEKKVRSFIITEKEALDLIQRINQVSGR